MSVKESIAEDLSMEALAIQPDQEEGIDLLQIAIAVLRHKRVWLGCTALCMILAIALVSRMSNKYTAQTVIMPPQQSQSTASMIMGQFGVLAGLGGNLGAKSSTDLYSAMLKTSRIENALVSRFDLQHVYRKKEIG